MSCFKVGDVVCVTEDVADGRSICVGDIGVVDVVEEQNYGVTFEVLDEMWGEFNSETHYYKTNELDRVVCKRS